ncbi:hypothetical protein CF326_g7742 [Tilletia indica]|nr:hypothetical protein CF326_g7742 [Tilletia indica]
MFQKNCVKAVQALQAKCDIGKIKYEHLDLEVRVPKGDTLWRTPIAVHNEERFTKMKENLFGSPTRYAESKIHINEITPDESSESEPGDLFSEDEDDSEDANANVGSKRKRSQQEKSSTSIDKQKSITLCRLQSTAQQASLSRAGFSDKAF